MTKKTTKNSIVKLNEIQWKEFFIGGENGLFDITSSSSGIDKNKLNIEEKNSNIPYITRSNIDNGINQFITINQLDKYNLDEGNVITIGLDTQTVFYQPHSFYTGQNIQVLRHKKINKFNALFLIPLIEVQMEKFNWGGNGATLGRLFRTKIMLPITNKGNLDWNYMETYGKNILIEKQEQYKQYIQKVFKKLNYKKIDNLQEKNWKEFFLTDIFTEIQRGKRLTKANQIQGKKPYVSSSRANNGVDNYIENEEKVRIFSDCLSLANSGSVGASFYHSYEFVASDHITHLKNENFNEYIYLFISTLTSRLSEKYNFNREINDKRISREKILLPINDKEEPDYVYMAQYIINMKYKKIKQYLTFKEK
ncbi:restriction endonuclease subunit S [Halarcobacter bivalviorum]|uniref:Restriction endonuclease n=1 Tax=Halarcobacter bivalviorum TaxID=663364 RepID=A0AAX2A5A5_9BACT|nr:restriction endonuclease subunit S [Halarcobacter bivalviorum]AXH11406.1 type IIB restriction/modification system, specificity subunit [Halarcobacter bivalviorum]RXK09407.1 restriction endonuclease [Halarcobacter bivalviorum]